MKFALLSVLYGAGAEKYINNFLINNSDSFSFKNHVKVVVDHGSNSIPLGFWNLYNILYIKNENNGFGSGVNVGLKFIFEELKYDYAIIMNPDILFNYLELSEICCNLLEDFYVLQLKEYGQDKSILYYSYLLGYVSDKAIPFSVEFFNGAAFIMSKNLYIKNILFDERYFMYFEDLDLSLYLHRENIKINIIKTTKMYHEVGGCTEKSDRAFIEKKAAISGLKFTLKNFPVNIFLYLRYAIKYIAASFRY